MFSIVIVNLWRGMRIFAVFFMAGLTRIPPDTIGSARIDRASALQRIFRIILLNLEESCVICGLWVIIQSVKVFERPFAMTDSGLGTSTSALHQYTWMSAFKHYEMGYALATGYFMEVVILILSRINLYVNRTKDENEVERKKTGKGRNRA